MNINNPQISDIPALRELWREAFNDTDEYLDSFFAKAFHPSRCRCICDNNTIVAALYWFDCTYENSIIAYIYAVATAKSHRGMGLCRRLMDDTHQHLTALGYSGALLVPGSQKLFDMYAKLGYVNSSSIREFLCRAKPQELSIFEITKNEYAKLRKSLLPSGSVLQEKENLDFLETQVNFYMGHGFLLASYIDKHTLHGIELLGDTNVAPALTYHFDCAHGIFRSFGNDKPFTMYHPLNGTTLLPPKYFCFAFD